MSTVQANDDTILPVAGADSADFSGHVDVLCESCGYRLNGLPLSGNCPECGTPVAESTVGSGRELTSWEAQGGFSGFFATSVRVLFRPTRFYRTLQTRVGEAELRRSARFARLHLLLASAVASAAIVAHGRAVSTSWVGMVSPSLVHVSGVIGGIVEWLVLAVLAFLAMAGTKALAERLTTWEAGWRGLRLPQQVVRRGMDYHVVHVLPVVLIVLLIAVAFLVLITSGIALGLDAGNQLPALFEGYLYVLAGACAVGAIYLFWTYWIGMRNMLHANV